MTLRTILSKTGILLLISLNGTVALGQTGSINGQVKDAKTGETLPGANIVIDGTTTGSITDFDGHYKLENLKTGRYDIRVSFVSYETVLLQGINVESGKSTLLDIKLTGATTAINEVTVIAVRRSDTEMSVLNAVKNNPLIANGLSSRQIAMTQDKDVSEAIRRIPGITIIDNRFVVVRGLSQRYNSVWLNNASTPGSESDSKAFSFDIIPSNMVDNLMIYKSNSPELPADFTGGFVSIHTKNMPERTQYSVSIQGLINPQTTFHTFLNSQGGGLDFLGIDDGTRTLPSYFPANLQEVSVTDQVELTKKLDNRWAPVKSAALPDGKFSFSMAHRIKAGHTSIGEITSVNYSSSRNFFQAVNRSFSVYDFVQDHPGMDFDFKDSTYTHNVSIGILNNWSWYLGKGNKIEFRNLLSNLGESRTLFRNGTEYYSNTRIRSFEYAFRNRLTYSGQLSGTHAFDKKNSQVDWVLGYAWAHLNEPDIRRVKQILNENRYDPGYGTYFLDFPSNPLSSNAGRIFMNTLEGIVSGAINYEIKLPTTAFCPKIRTGIFFESKNRSFNARKLGYIFSNNLSKDPSIQYVDVFQLLTNNYYNSTTGIRLAEETGKSDSYNAADQLEAAYVSVSLQITNRMTLFTGVRAEGNRQTLSSYDRFQQPITVDHDTLNLFPSANLTWNLSDKTLVRAAYGKSINRPEFREIAPFPFYNFQNNAVFSGNPALRNAYIDNFDLRFENYPSNNEWISFGLFYKKFRDPIEIRYIETGSGLEYSFQNARSAINYGIELELRKALASDGFFNRILLVFNGSLIESQVRFDPGSIEQNRPLSGQSPYVINFGLFWSDHDRSGWNISLMYNVIGPRIFIVGQPKTSPWEYIPNIYEMPRNLVDLMITKKIGKHLEIKAGIKDLLNQPVQYRQDIHTQVDLAAYGVDGGRIQYNRRQVVREYRPGSCYSIGLQWIL